MTNCGLHPPSPSPSGHADTHSLENWAAVSARAITGSTKTTSRSGLRAHNLPDWSTIGEPCTQPIPDQPQGQKLTAHPSANIKADLEQRLLKLVHPLAFENLLHTSHGREVFRSWLERNEPADSSAIIKLDQWTDEIRLHGLVELVKQQSEDVFNLYYKDDCRRTSEHPALRSETSQASLQELTKLASLDNALKSSRRELLESMYAHEFQRFITSKLIEQTKLRLGRELSENLEASSRDTTGLGDAFCLCNPRLRDTPIVMVTAGFVAVTGYEREEILGRNCRFLQGPATTKSSIERIRKAVQNKTSIVELLLNYRRDGTPFHCLLSIMPLFDAEGNITYFIGGQVNVTGDLESSHQLLTLVSKHMEKASAQERDPAVLADSPLMNHFKNRAPTKTEDGGSTDLGEHCSAYNRRVIGSKHSGSNHGPKKQFNEFLSWFASKKKRASEENGVVDGGAVQRFGVGALPIEDQFEAFEVTYSRLLIFKRDTLQVVFATPRTLQYLGLPTKTRAQIHCSPVLNTSFLDLVASTEASFDVTRQKATKKLTAKLRTAIKQGVPVSCECDLVFGPSGDDMNKTRDMLSKSVQGCGSKSSMIHLTPFIDCHAESTAYIVILSE